MVIDHSSHNTIGGETATREIASPSMAATAIRVLSGIDNRIAAIPFTRTSFPRHQSWRLAHATTPGDADAASNHLQNYPLLTYADSLGFLAGTLNTPPQPIFHSSSLRTPPVTRPALGEGEVYLRARSPSPPMAAATPRSRSLFSSPSRRTLHHRQRPLTRRQHVEFSPCSA